MCYRPHINTRLRKCTKIDSWMGCGDLEIDIYWIADSKRKGPHGAGLL